MNARYWLLMHKMAETLHPEGGTYSAEQFHLYCKTRFLGCDDVPLPGGKTLVQPRSTADLSTDEFGGYMEAVEAFAASHGAFLDE